MDPVRVIEIRGREKSRADQVLADARRNLHIAQKECERLREEAAAKAKVAADLQEQQKELEGKLATAKLKAELDKYSAELEENHLAQRLANYDVLTSNGALSEADQREADLAAAVTAAQKAASDAAAAYEEGNKQEELFASWKSALAAKALADAVALAPKVKDGGTPEGRSYAAASARLARLLGGTELLDVYRQRAWFAAENAALARNRLVDATRKAAEARDRIEPLARHRMAALAHFGIWIACLQDAAEGTITRLAAARKTFDELARWDAATEAKEPLASRLARLHEFAAQVKAVGAPAKEKAVFDATRELHLRQQAQAAAEIEAVGDEPDEDPAEHPDLQDEIAATQAAADALKAAEEAWQAGPKESADPADPPSKVSAKKALDRYEVALPPDLLTDVVAFFDAEMAIDTVMSTDLEEIAKTFREAETAYAKAEEVEVRERRAVAMVDALLEAAQRRSTASAGAAAVHKLLTIRGDR